MSWVIRSKSRSWPNFVETTSKKTLCRSEPKRTASSTTPRQFTPWKSPRGNAPILECRWNSAWLSTSGLKPAFSPSG